jgi:hypothetical protein
MSDPSTSTVSVARALPSVSRVVVMTILSASASIVVNAALVWLATAFNPALQHFSHFRLSDYGTLTGVGAAAAGAAWYLTTRNLRTPRRTFFRVAVVAMVLLWVPDLWLLMKHEPTRAVVYLMIMHATVALITYNFLVHGAPAGVGEVSGAATLHSPLDDASEDQAISKAPRVMWVSLMIAVALEFVGGLVGLAYVPFNRPDGWLSPRGETIYLFHAILGGLLGLAAVVVVVQVSQTTPRRRVDHVGAVSGLCGVLVGAVGGLLCVSHPLRLLGMALMFLGASVAFFGYLIPTIEDSHPLASVESPRDD